MGRPTRRRRLNPPANRIIRELPRASSAGQSHADQAVFVIPGVVRDSGGVGFAQGVAVGVVGVAGIARRIQMVPRIIVCIDLAIGIRKPVAYRIVTIVRQQNRAVATESARTWLRATRYARELIHLVINIRSVKYRTLIRV